MRRSATATMETPLMDRIGNDIQTLAASELTLSQAISQGNKPRRTRTPREKALATLISKAWIITGRNLPTSEEEIALIVAAYAEALADIPNEELVEAFKAGIRIHREKEDVPFKPEFILEGWGELKRAQRHERERDRAKAELDGTYNCRYCEDSGFQKVMYWCPTLQNWQGRMRGCKCEAAPVGVRHDDIPCEPGWKPDKKGYWEPKDSKGYPCGCAYCSNGAGIVRDRGAA